MDYLSASNPFSSLSIEDLLAARDAFHPHLMHKENVVGTAIGRYLIRQSDPYPGKEGEQSKDKCPRTLENSEVRDYSWPCVLVFVSRWIDEADFRSGGSLHPDDFVPKTIYLPDGRSVPVCVVEAPLEESVESVALEDLEFPDVAVSGGYPVVCEVQGTRRVGSVGCLVTDGHKVYALTNRHVAGPEGTELSTFVGGKKKALGRTAALGLGRLAFEAVYAQWPGRQVYVNADAGLIEIEALKEWSASVYGIGPIGALADLSVYNLSVSLIGCPVRAHGAASGALSGRIAALFYRYKSVGGFEYVADFLIGSRGDAPLATRPGDSGTVWVLESDDPKMDRRPIALQWGGASFVSGELARPFALATNLSTVCRELGLELYRGPGTAAFEYWGAVGHYAIGSIACALCENADLRALMMANQTRVSFKDDEVTKASTGVKPPDFVPLADVPDKVWKVLQSQASYGRKGPENPNHYADIDFPHETEKPLGERTTKASELTVERWKAYYDAIGWNEDRERGCVPFRVWQIYRGMVEFVRDKDVAGFVAAAGILAHYVGDCCQPLHGSYLDDGDPFRKPDGSEAHPPMRHGKGYAGGVHVAYEDRMVDANVVKIMEGLRKLKGHGHGMHLVTGGQNAGYAALELIRSTARKIAPMDIVERYGQIVRDQQTGQSSKLMWASFGEKTIEAMQGGCKTLAMLWDSAWEEGGGDAVPKAKLGAVSTQALRQRYEDQAFLESAPLNKIEPLLG
jgi:hypothetical protein